MKESGKDDPFPLQRKVRSVGFNHNEKSEWNANPDMSFNANDLRREKKIQHDFRTRKHYKKTLEISQVPLPENERIEKVSFFQLIKIQPFKNKKIFCTIK